jgi:hypothetical protein
VDHELSWGDPHTKVTNLDLASLHSSLTGVNIKLRTAMKALALKVKQGPGSFITSYPHTIVGFSSGNQMPKFAFPIGHVWRMFNGTVSPKSEPRNSEAAQASLISDSGAQPLVKFRLH